MIHASWKPFFKQQMKQNYFRTLTAFLEHERALAAIYPEPAFVFNSMRLTAFDSITVCLLGQDPYYQPGQAHGLAFSVPPGVKKPPSLRNIFKELQHDCDITEPESGDLSAWAKQGVLLLNTILTVRRGQPASHHGAGWETFTDAILSTISASQRGIIFLLWGAYAQKKESLIDIKRHHILKAAHPSPFSAMNGFFGSNHFSRANKLLIEHGKNPINWQL
ncbi:MAG: uracil-DNA glycosylase [Chitinivibrionales bacterium]|nr:uracil-DNA glycosylase [Chitinivibrionales bacterium]